MWGCRLSGSQRASKVTRIDRPGTLFYLDPPYWGSEGDYGKGMFGRDDFQRLAEQLHGIKGRFLLSINDVPDIRDLFAWARIDEVDTSYSFGNRTGGRGERQELLIQGGNAD